MNTIEQQFKIGQKAWVSRAGNYTEVWVTCPHCFGNKYLTVILGDDSQVTIDCECCKRGYDGCAGKIQEYQFVAGAQQITIENVEFRDGGFRYNHEDENCVFASEQEAIAKAETLRTHHEAQEARRIECKKDQNRTWAWNATYHRRELKRAQSELAYHTAALDVAKKKAKEL